SHCGDGSIRLTQTVAIDSTPRKASHGWALQLQVGRVRGQEMPAARQRDDYFFVPAPISRKRSTAMLGPKFSNSKTGRISHSLSPPRRPGASTCTNRLVHSIASAFDVNWRFM